MGDSVAMSGPVLDILLYSQSEEQMPALPCASAGQTDTLMEEVRGSAPDSQDPPEPNNISSSQGCAHEGLRPSPDADAACQSAVGAAVASGEAVTALPRPPESVTVTAGQDDAQAHPAISTDEPFRKTKSNGQEQPAVARRRLTLFQRMDVHFKGPEAATPTAAASSAASPVADPPTPGSITRSGEDREAMASPTACHDVAAQQAADEAAAPAACSPDDSVLVNARRHVRRRVAAGLADDDDDDEAPGGTSRVVQRAASSVDRADSDGRASGRLRDRHRSDGSNHGDGSDLEDGSELGDEGGEGDEQAEEGDEYWDEEDEMADALVTQAERKASRKVKPGAASAATGGSPQAGADKADDEEASGSGSGSEEGDEGGSEGEGGGNHEGEDGGSPNLLNTDLQRKLRETAVRDRIGKGFVAAARPMSDLLAKLRNRQQGLVERATKLTALPPPKPLPPPAPTTLDFAQLMKVAEQRQLVGVTAKQPTGGAPGGGTDQDPHDEDDDLLIEADDQAQADVAHLPSAPSLELQLLGDTQVPAAEPHTGNPMPPAAATVTAALLRAAHVRMVDDGNTARQDNNGGLAGQPNVESQPSQQLELELDESEEELEGVSEGDDGESGDAGSEDEGGEAGSGSGDEGAEEGSAAGGSGSGDEDDDGDGSGSASSEEEEQEADQRDEELAEAEPLAYEELEAEQNPGSQAVPDAAAAGGAAPPPAQPRKGGKKKKHRGGRQFLEAEAELSDDGGGGSQGDEEDDGDDDDDGRDLADLIGTARETNGDELDRAALHRQWEDAEEAKAMRAILHGVQHGFARPTANGALGGADGEGTDAEARRRRAALAAAFANDEDDEAAGWSSVGGNLHIETAPDDEEEPALEAGGTQGAAGGTEALDLQAMLKRRLDQRLRRQQMQEEEESQPVSHLRMDAEVMAMLSRAKSVPLPAAARGATAADGGRTAPSTGGRGTSGSDTGPPLPAGRFVMFGRAAPVGQAGGAANEPGSFLGRGSSALGGHLRSANSNMGTGRSFVFGTNSEHSNSAMAAGVAAPSRDASHQPHNLPHSTSGGIDATAGQPLSFAGLGGRLGNAPAAGGKSVAARGVGLLGMLGGATKDKMAGTGRPAAALGQKAAMPLGTLNFARFGAQGR